MINTTFFEIYSLSYILKNDYIYIIPEIFFSITLIILLLCGVWMRNVEQKLLIREFAWLLLFLSVCYLLLLNNDLNIYKSLFFDTILITKFTTIIKMISTIFFITISLISIPYYKQSNIKGFEFLIIKGFSFIILCFILQSNDFMIFYILLEMQAICVYILCTLHMNAVYAIDAAIKYYIMGAFTSIILALGLVMLYSYTGTLNFDDIYKFMLKSYLIENHQYFEILIVVTLTSAFLFKIAAVPFHIWAPEVYNGAPLPLTLYLITLPKIIMIILGIKIYYYCFNNLSDIWQLIFFISGLLSLIYGSFTALYEGRIKKFLAYSSIVQVGNLLYGLASNNITGVTSVILYLITYIIISIGLFSILMYNNRSRGFITDLSYLTKNYMSISVLFSILFISLAGLPPFAGFWIKFYILISATIDQYYILVFTMIIMTLFSTYYYIKIYKVAIIDVSTEKIEKNFDNKSNRNISILFISILWNILYFIYMEDLYIFIEKFIYLI